MWGTEYRLGSFIIGERCLIGKLIRNVHRGTDRYSCSDFFGFKKQQQRMWTWRDVFYIEFLFVIWWLVFWTGIEDLPVRTQQQISNSFFAIATSVIPVISEVLRMGFVESKARCSHFGRCDCAIESYAIIIIILLLFLKRVVCPKVILCGWPHVKFQELTKGVKLKSDCSYFCVLLLLFVCLFLLFFLLFFVYIVVIFCYVPFTVSEVKLFVRHTLCVFSNRMSSSPISYSYSLLMST